MEMKTVFTPDWKSWIKTNVDAGQNLDGIFKILIDEGYSFAAIEEEMNYRPSCPTSELKNPFDIAGAEATRSAKQNLNKVHQLAQYNNFSDNDGMPICSSQIHIPNAVSLESDKIDLRTVDNFLNAEECDKLISLIKPKLRPSKVSNFQINSNVRTSQTCDLGRLDYPFIQNVDDRICQLIGINRVYSEVIQGQYYEVGQEFKAHTDFFDPHEFDTHCHAMGQRTYTVMVYLNDVEQGGETCFNRVGAKFKPETGKVVIWNNLKPNGKTNMDSLHQAKPVEKGFKAVITKWFRTTCPTASEDKMFITDF